MLIMPADSIRISGLMIYSPFDNAQCHEEETITHFSFEAGKGNRYRILYELLNYLRRSVFYE
ncbi:hypothetical protein SDC9_155572 [bioreactor metagenome]|uniref:Uncharacterized protein n=1 Tax=bioreactor metagenome TaxID=1076179 RepID=A0A645F387_9ZZZZ